MEFTQEKLENLMRIAHEEVEQAILAKNSPFGAILVDHEGMVVERAHNTANETNDPTAHAEINLLRKAAQKLRSLQFNGYSVIASGEPCSMCSSAIIKAHINHIYYGAPHEESMDPMLSIEEVVARAKTPIYVQGGILKEESVALVQKGRESLRK